MNTETFWAQIEAYNIATWPVQVLLMLGGILLTYRAFVQPGPQADRWLKVFLAATFAWNGVVFFLIFAQNPIATFIGFPLFMVVALLFALDIFAGQTHFSLPATPWKRAFTGLWFALVLLYPLIGWVLGHSYPRLVTPMLPCPLTVFALALVTAALPQVDRKVYIALLPWALLALPKCFGALDCYEDCILFAAGVYGTVLLFKQRKPQSTDEK